MCYCDVYGLCCCDSGDMIMYCYGSSFVLCSSCVVGMACCFLADVCLVVLVFCLVMFLVLACFS